MADQKYITALQPFVLAAKTAEGDAAAELVLQATQFPGCFVFSELLECESIQALAATHPQHLELLKIFAYGSLADYRSNSNLPPLDDRQLEKLKQLSLITIASRGTQDLTYASLLKSLELPSVRALEDLVISAIYAGLLQAKLDTAYQLVDISSTAGRDVAPAEIDDMVAKLNAWSQQCDDVLADIDGQIERVHREALQKRKDNEDYEKQISQIKATIQRSGDEKGLSKGKRVISEGAEDGRDGWGEDEDGMDLDDVSHLAEGPVSWGSNTGRRRNKGRFGSGLGNKRRS
ncbi:hypothetical protein BZA77DRAFT_262789 [Pyronema omphalodes]|nr:hypothetical protein BZA77DRAFT_262789 [Pyronema omphalodes]